jgi:hypothetical protein
MLFVAARGPGREPTENEPALLLVQRVVEVDHREVGALVDVRPAPVERGVALVVFFDGPQVLIPRDGPQLLYRIPVHRGFVAKPCVVIPRIDVELRVEQVDPLIRTALVRHVAAPAVGGR